MIFINQPTIKDLAQCSLDVYFDSADNDLRSSSFSKQWTRQATWGGPDAFLAQFYLNRTTGVGVMAIRGTVPSKIEDDLADLAYFFHMSSNQYKDGLSFLQYLRRQSLWNSCQKQYVTGHSLGGIIAKKLARETGLDTLCFNSPGVDFHRGRNHQKVYTYISEKDVIGNFNNKIDHGMDKIIPMTTQKHVAENNHMKGCSWHSMRLMYLTMCQGEYCNGKF